MAAVAAFAGVAAWRGRARGGAPRVCRRVAPVRACADRGGAAAPPRQEQPDSGPLSDGGKDGVGQRRERQLREAAEARLEAERLELLAAQARLGAERAQLKAERKRLELDQLKVKVERGKRRPGDPEPVVEEVVEKVEKVEVGMKEEKEKEKGVKVDGKSVMGMPAIGGANMNELLGVDFPRIAEEDIRVLREKVISMNVFYVTEVDRSPFDERVVFRGNLRVAADTVLDELEKLLVKEGLEERVRLFLLMDPRPAEDGSGEDKPVVVALPAAAIPNQTTTAGALLAVIAALLSMFTCFSYGIGIFGLNPAFLAQLVDQTLEAEQALYILPIAVGALGIVVAHELAHRVAASVHKVKLGLPVFLPSLQVGSYGTITPLQSYPRRRVQLFDVAASGPVVGCSLSLALLVAGMLITGSVEAADWFPQIPSVVFKGSILVGALGKVLLPSGMIDQASLAVHPLVVVGYTGLVVNALNLIPIGRLDGGRIVQALYGRTTAARVTGLTFLLQGVATIAGNSSLLLYWSLICVFLQREPDYPCQDEVTEPDDRRFALGLGALLFMIAVLTPFPEQM